MSSLIVDYLSLSLTENGYSAVILLITEVQSSTNAIRITKSMAREEEFVLKTEPGVVFHRFVMVFIDLLKLTNITTCLKI